MPSMKTTAVRSFGKFSVSSIGSSIIDLAAFSVLCDALYPRLPESIAIMGATVTARVISSLCNYLLNYFLVFHSHTAHGRSASLYTLITVLKTAASALLVARLAALLPFGTPALAVKIPVDVALFFANFAAQKWLVY